jgi:GT2 family glycosyltransferase
MKHKERIACQLVSFNSEKTIRESIKSLLRLESPDIEIILVILDNASSDGTRGIIRETLSQYSGVHEILFEDRNLGFSGGHNRAMESSFALDASYITLINPDLTLKPDAIYLMRKAFDAGHKIGAVCPRLYRSSSSFSDKESPLLLDSTGMVFHPSFRHFDRGSNMRALTEDGRPKYPFPEYVPGASGACVMFSRECIEDISFPPEISGTNFSQFLDEDFFAYREDAEASLRMKWRGWKVRYEPLAEGYHVRHVLPHNRKELSKTINALGVQNRFLLQIQTLPVLGFIMLCPMVLVRNLIVIFACFIKERSSFKGIRNVFTLLPVTLKKRRWILSQRKISILSFISIFYSSKRQYPALKKTGTPTILTSALPSLHVSIVSYHQSKEIDSHLEAILESLSKVPSWNLSITNNYPEDKHFDSLVSKYQGHPTIHFIQPGENIGFAGANNHAFKDSTADIFLLMNPDISPEASSLVSCLSHFSAYSNLGALSPVLIDEKTKAPQMKYLAKRLPSFYTLLANLLFLDTINENNSLSQYETYHDDPELASLFENEAYPVVYEIDQAAGACLFIPATIYRKLGGLDTTFHPAWFEDVDFAKKVQEAGLVSGVFTGAKVTHEGGSSVSYLSRPRLLTFFYRNMRLYWKKHAPSMLSKKTALFVIFICFSTRRIASFFKSKVSKEVNDSLRQMKADFQFFLK